MQKHYYDLTDEMPDADGEVILTITPKKYFDENRCLSDAPMDSDVLLELKKCGLYGSEMMDSMLELSNLNGQPITKTEAKTKLENHPDFVTFSSNF